MSGRMAWNEDHQWAGDVCPGQAGTGQHERGAGGRGLETETPGGREIDCGPRERQADKVNDEQQILLIPVKLQLKAWMSILTALNASPSSSAVISAC